MSGLAIRSGTLSGPSVSGYFLAFHDGVNENVCAVAFRDDGEMLALRLSGPDATTDGLLDRIGNEPLPPRTDVRWAFAMAGASSADHLAEALGVPHVDRDTAISSVSEAVTQMSPSLGGSVDREALGALASSPAKRTASFSFYRGDTERAQRRRQAAKAYPLLADFLATGLATKMAIDRSQPLADAVAAALSGFADSEVGRAVVKRISQSDPIPDGCTLDTVVRFMAAVPADWIPSKGPEWVAFCNAAHGILEDLGAEDGAVETLVRGCGGRWTEFCSRIAKKGGQEEDGCAAMRRVMSAASEMAECFSTVCVLPLAAHASPTSTVSMTPELLHRSAAAARAMLLGGRSAADIADLQRRWHQERAAILDGTRMLQDERNAELRGEIEEGGWPSLTATVQAPNGLWLVPLTNAAELADEGSHGVDANGVAGLHHCVGSYANRARSCDCHIVSVREIDGKGGYRRLSTVEFGAIQPGSDRLSVKQNKARGNGSPTNEVKDAVNWYMASVAGGLLPINRSQIAAFLESGALPEDGIERLCGYDWKERDLLNAAVAPWGRFVAPAFRGMDLDGVMDSKEIATLSELIPPEILLAPGR